MTYFLAVLPILVLLGLMVLLRWGGQKAGPAGWLVGVLVAWLAFGLTPQVWWVSQARGLLLSFYVLLVLWPALLLYNLVNEVGGIRAVASGLSGLISDRGLLWVVTAWAFSGVLEGLAGFGLPLAVVAPMLVALGVQPVIAVAAVAVGHSWSVTFGDMGVIFQTLVGVSKMDGAELAPPAALILGVACLACGMGAALLLGQGRKWPWVLVLGGVMAAVQYGLVVSGLTPLGSLGAGLAGVGAAVLVSRRGAEKRLGLKPDRSLKAALGSYGGLAVWMTLMVLIRPLNAWLAGVIWQAQFPQVSTLQGFVTPAGGGQVFRFLVHPGTSILLTACISYGVYRWKGILEPGGGRRALAATWHAAAPTSVGIIAAVGISALMDHCGMTQLLAQGLSSALGAQFPLVSPLVGILGAFATGSNNNSNVLFAPLQKSAAMLLGIAPALLLAAQTAGGSLGSMIAPAKIIVGCSTAGCRGRDGEVLRLTLPYGLITGLLVGVLAWILS
jgi:lactate permease